MNNFKQNIYKIVTDEIAPTTVEEILLGYSTINGSTACSNISTPVIRYMPLGQDWTMITFLYQDSVGTIPAISGYYSNGGKWYYWDESTSTSTSTGFC